MQLLAQSNHIRLRLLRMREGRRVPRRGIAERDARRLHAAQGFDRLAARIDAASLQALTPTATLRLASLLARLHRRLGIVGIGLRAANRGTQANVAVPRQRDQFGERHRFDLHPAARGLQFARCSSHAQVSSKGATSCCA